MIWPRKHNSASFAPQDFLPHTQKVCEAMTKWRIRDDTCQNPNLWLSHFRYHKDHCFTCSCKPKLTVTSYCWFPKSVCFKPVCVLRYAGTLSHSSVSNLCVYFCPLGHDSSLFGFVLKFHTLSSTWLMFCQCCHSYRLPWLAKSWSFVMVTQAIVQYKCRVCVRACTCMIM